MVARYYPDATRYTTSSFLRTELEALQRSSIPTYYATGPSLRWHPDVLVQTLS
jgi:hypothetical protein